MTLCCVTHCAIDIQHIGDIYALTLYIEQKHSYSPIPECHGNAMVTSQYQNMLLSLLRLRENSAATGAVDRQAERYRLWVFSGCGVFCASCWIHTPADGNGTRLGSLGFFVFVLVLQNFVVVLTADRTLATLTSSKNASVTCTMLLLNSLLSWILT
jgi:hypothetical protein